MKMHALPIALVALLLTACGDKPAPASTAATPADKPQAAAAAKPKAAPAGKALATPMPQGVEIRFPYHLRSDVTEPAKDGDPRRVVRVQALGGDVAKIAESVRKSMKAAGFRPMEVSEEASEDAPKPAEGSERLTFKKKDWDGRVQVLLAPVGEDDKGHKKATTSVTFLWNGAGIAAAAPAPAPAAAKADAADAAAPAETPAGE
jgi:hypothetical protein